MAKIKSKVTVVQPKVDKYGLPTVDISGVPATIDVADTINPIAHVEYDGNPIQGVVCDFFVKDLLGLESMGRETTDVNGDASAADIYYVSEAEAENTLNFIIVTRSKKL